MAKQPDPLKPSASLLVKLVSVIVHQEEAMSAKGHDFDLVALETVRNDEEVTAWLAQMIKLGFAPVKR